MRRRWLLLFLPGSRAQACSCSSRLQQLLGRWTFPTRTKLVYRALAGRFLATGSPENLRIIVKRPVYLFPASEEKLHFVPLCPADAGCLWTTGERRGFQRVWKCKLKQVFSSQEVFIFSQMGTLWREGQSLIFLYPSSISSQVLGTQRQLKITITKLLVVLDDSGQASTWILSCGLTGVLGTWFRSYYQRLLSNQRACPVPYGIRRALVLKRDDLGHPAEINWSGLCLARLVTGLINVQNNDRVFLCWVLLKGSCTNSSGCDRALASGLSACLTLSKGFHGFKPAFWKFSAWKM